MRATRVEQLSCFGGHHLKIAAVVYIAIVGIGGCHQADAVDPTFEPSALFAKLALTEHAITLSTIAPFDTTQLHVAATLGDGTTVPVPVTYSASDSTITVDSTGRVRARFVTATLSYVRVSVTYQGVTRRDSVACQVQSSALSGSVVGVQLQLPPGASPQIPIQYLDTTTGGLNFGNVQLNPVAVGPIGERHPEILVTVSSDDSTIATISQTGFVSALRPGYVTLRATASVYGSTFRDSLRVLVGASQFYGFGAVDTVLPETSAHLTRWNPDTARVGVGALVQWQNFTPVAIDVVFDDTTGIDSASFDPLDGVPTTGPGNIAPFGGPNAPVDADFFTYLISITKARRFSHAGVYTFHSTLTSAHGVLIVCALDDPCYHH